MHRGFVKNATKGKKLSRREYLSNIFKFSLFRSPTFVVVCISSFFQSIGWFVPFVYLAGNLKRVIRTASSNFSKLFSTF